MSSITRKIADEIALHGSWEAYLKWDAAQSQERIASAARVITDADIQKMKRKNPTDLIRHYSTLAANDRNTPI